MQALQDEGIEVYMMSGDKEEAARYWAEKAGIKHYRSKVLPQDKEDMVKELQKKGTVGAVGDGINDTQALALADVSIAIGKGTDVAMDVAQVTLMGDDLSALPKAVRLSRHGQDDMGKTFSGPSSIMLCAYCAHALPRDRLQITPVWASALMALSR